MSVPDTFVSPLDQLTQMTMTVNATQGPQVDFARNVASEVTNLTRRVGTGGPTIGSVFTRDALGRVTALTHSSSLAGQLSTFGYGYDPLNRVTSYSGPEGSLSYRYFSTDELDQVTGSRSEDYDYDLNGNRQTVGLDTYSTTDPNRLATHGTVTFLYDGEGNRTRATDSATDQETDYYWDHRNRLTKVEVRRISDGALIREARFTYDVHDRLIGRWIDVDGAQAGAPVQTWTAYDVAGKPAPGRLADNVFADFDGSGAITNRYVNSHQVLDEVYARMDAAGDTDWYMTDRQGSVRQIVDTDGVILDALTYDSFGNILSETNPSQGDRFKYNAREWEAAIALYSNRARWYSALDGRFISEDPIGFEAGDSNLSRYVQNNPVSAVDPTGLWELRCRDLAGEAARHCWIWCDGHSYSLSKTKGRKGTPTIDDPDDRRKGDVVATGNDPCGCFVAQYNANKVPYPYEPTDCNSNYFASQLLRCCGIEVAVPKGAVGWGRCQREEGKFECVDPPCG